MRTATSGCPIPHCPTDALREKKDTRLFFALWPEPDLRDRLQAAAETVVLPPGARRVPQPNLHLTLHFIGNVYYGEMDCLRQQAREVDAVAFSLQVDTQGCFRQARVGWLGLSHPPAALHDLHRLLGEQLLPCDYRPEQRAYNPHVTVARKLTRLDHPPTFTPIDWRVESFALIEVLPAENGVQYRVVETYPLS